MSQPLNDAYKANFQTLLRAAGEGRLALMSCADAVTGETRAVICAVSGGDGEANIGMVPLGHLCPGDPHEAYVPPEPLRDV